MEKEAAFTNRMEALYGEVGQATGYWPHRFLREVRKKGGLSTARRLLKDKKRVSEGLEKLNEIGRLDASMEALVLEGEWRSLFSEEELAEAQSRLSSYGYRIEVGTQLAGDWSNDELRAAVKAYIEMLGLEATGKRYSKTEYNSRLRDGPLHQRSRGSVEFRMQNISATLADLGLPWISGYKPRGNVGEGVKLRILGLLAEEEPQSYAAFLPTADDVQVKQRTAAILRSCTLKRPAGRPEPKHSERAASVFERSPAVRAYVLQVAAGVCELCRQPAPFVDDDGFPFLEVHHVIALACGGPDVVENAVAVCPNCHRLLHHSRERDTASKLLFQQIKRLQI